MVGRCRLRRGRPRPCHCQGWFVEVGVIAQCVVVCCDRAVDVEVKGVASVGAGVRIVVLWCRGCGEHVRRSGVDDGGHALVTDVAVYLVVDVGVSA